jgi:hypothetical protein
MQINRSSPIFYGSKSEKPYEAIKEGKGFDWYKLVGKSKDFQALKRLISRNKEFFKADYNYRKEKGWLD